MNKKIFLTSMVALMIACPAFGTATLVPDPNNSNTNSGYIPDPDTSAACNTTPLTYQDTSVPSGTYTLTAQWEPHVCPITLDPNNGSGETQGGDASNASKTIHSKYGVGAYKTYDSVNQTVSDLMSGSSNNITNLPVGRSATITFVVNCPAGQSCNSVPSMTVTRLFRGYYPDPSTSPVETWLANNTPYINSSGYIQSGGTSAAALIQKIGDPLDCPSTTWYAQYSCISQAFPTIPTVTGYTADSTWSDGAGMSVAPGTAQPGLCVDKTFSVSYTANTYDVIYVAGTCSGNGYTDQDVLTYASNPNYSVLGISAAGVSEPTGYHFTYWTPSVNIESDTQYEANDTYGANNPWVTNDDLTFTANCAANEYTVTYDCDVGTVIDGISGLNYTSGDNSGTNTATYNQNYDFGARTPANTCEDLTGSHTLPAGASWTCVQTGTNTPVNPAWPSSTQTWQYTYDVTCKVTWDDVITLVWNPDNGQNSDTNTCTWGASASDANGAKVPTSLLNPTKPGYTFTGWLVTDHQ